MSNFKRILSLALTMLMVIGCFATVSAFNDVTEYEDEIDALYDLGIIEGKDAEGTTYAPDEDVTRWQMALLIAKMMTGKVENAYVNWYSTENFTPFTDVNADQFYGSMSYAHNMGVIRGTTDTTFNPNGNITYQDALTMLVRALGYGSAEMDAGYPWTFIDKAIELGLDDGMADELNYGDALTRGEVAKLLYNTLYADRYNDPYAWNDYNEYTCFAYDVFEYFAADVTVMIVAAEGIKLNAATSTFFAATGLDYTEYNKLIDAKKGSYVGFAITYADPNSEYYEMIGDVMVLPASEFGLEKASRTDLGKSFNVVFSDYYFGNDVTGVKEFDKCMALDADLYDQTKFAFANKANTTTLETVTIDGTTYYAVSQLSKHLTNGDRNTAYNNDEILVINAETMQVMTSAPAYDYADLAAHDLNGDGIYDIAYYYQYRVGYVYDSNGADGVTTFYGGFNQAVGTMYDRTGASTAPDNKWVFYAPIDMTYDANVAATHGFEAVIIGRDITANTVVGVVTGIDLYNKTITIDSVDMNNVGTTYGYGLANTLGDGIDNIAGFLGFTTSVLGRRVSVVIDDVSGKAIQLIDNPLPAAPGEEFGIYVFVRDTGRDVKVGDATYDIIAVYDNNADIQYVTVQKFRDAGVTAATMIVGANIRLYDMGNGYYEVCYCTGAGDFGSYVTFDETFKVNEFGFIDYNNIYLNLKNAKVLIQKDNTFVEYDGEELGAGTWFSSGYGRVVSAYNGAGMYDVSFLYLFDYAGTNDYNVTAVTAKSESLSSIVYLYDYADNYAFINYDNVGGHNEAVYEITYYNAIDVITGELRTVTFEGAKDYRPTGFYYVDKNNELRQTFNGTTYTLVSAESEMTITNGTLWSCNRYEITNGTISKYGLTSIGYYKTTAGDNMSAKVQAWSTLFGENGYAPQPAMGVWVAIYTGSNYSSETAVAIGSAVGF